MNRIFFFLFFAIFSFSLQAKEYKFIGQEYPPFNWTDEKGKIVGLAPELVAKVCAKLSLKCGFEIIPVKRGLIMMEEGTTDGFMSLMHNKERDAFAYFGAVFAKSNLSFIKLHEQKGTYKKVEDLSGATVGVTANSATATVLYQYKREKVQSLTIVDEVTVTGLVSKLYYKRYGAKGFIFLNEDVARYLAKSNNYPAFDVVFVGEVQKFHIAFSKKSVDEKFANKFIMAFNQMKKTGELKEIYKKYSIKIEP